jgi:hypothetical protein
MAANKGYYSLIQYCPDLGRRESVNIGVLLLCPELNFMKALTDPALKRLCSCFAATEAERRRVEELRASIQRRLRAEAAHIRGLDDLKSFVASRGNAIQLTEPRPTKVYDAEKDLQRLFKRLVEPPSATVTRHAQSAVSSVPRPWDNDHPRTQVGGLRMLWQVPRQNDQPSGMEQLIGGGRENDITTVQSINGGSGLSQTTSMIENQESDETALVAAGRAEQGSNRRSVA